MPEQTDNRQNGLYGSSQLPAQSGPTYDFKNSPLAKIPITGKRGRTTLAYMLDELQQKTPAQPEALDKIDRSLPAPPAAKILARAIGSCLTHFLDFSGISKAVQESREYLLEAVCSLADENQRQAIAACMAEFETRMIRDHKAIAEGEINATYDNLRYLLKSEPTARSIPWQSRLLATQHFLSHAARPETLGQGSKIGSEVFCLAHKLFTTQPTRLTEMIASVAISGEWQTFDGKTMVIDEHSLKPGPEEILYRPGENRRSYAAKIIQVLMLNNCLRRRKRSMSYSETGGRPGKEYGGQTVRSIDGELLNPKYARISLLELALLAKFEFEETGFIIINSNSFAPQTPEFADLLSKNNLLVHVFSQEDLMETLREKKEQGMLPVTIAVDERRLLAESYADGINHCVNVVTFNEYGLLKVFNPHLLPGMQRDSRISLQRLYNSTLRSTKA